MLKYYMALFLRLIFFNFSSFELAILAGSVVTKHHEFNVTNYRRQLCIYNHVRQVPWSASSTIFMVGAQEFCNHRLDFS
jgi:hypothetical protein